MLYRFADNLLYHFRHRRFGWSACSLFVCLLLFSVAIPCNANSVELTYEFNIAQQRADLALRQFSDQAQQQVLYPFEDVKHFVTNQLKGRYTAKKAAKLLLKDTGLGYRFSRYDVLTVTVNKNKGEGIVGALSRWFGFSKRGGDADGSDRVVAGGVLDEVVVVGSRAAPRSVWDSSVPVDIIIADSVAHQSNTSMSSVLRSLLPSFNANVQAINDAATVVPPANLRGLPSDSMLLLVNGKRRHRAAVISLLGGGINDGAQGPDVSAISSVALKRIEVLRDGASAQYGSDAIAGVINYVLKDDRDGGSVEVHYGEYFAGDGETLQVSGNVGFPLATDGFINASFELKSAEPTNRSTQRSDAKALMAAGNTDIPNPAQTWGAPDRGERAIVFNMGKDIATGHKFYLFGNAGRRDVENGFYYRNPNVRSGVFSNDNGESLLIADLRPDDGQPCPTVAITNNTPDPVALAEVFENSHCWSFLEKFPGGFTPRFGGKVTDASLVLGVSGEWVNAVNYDISASAGRNAVDFRINNTVNSSLGPVTPTSFDLGSHIEAENAVNIDFSQLLSFPELKSQLNIAAGLEFREESFEIKAGEPASYAIGPLVTQGFSVGANGFQGFSPDDSGKFSRHSLAFYTDIEAEIRNWLFLGAAMRVENYSDFGSTQNGKFTGRVQATDNIAFRGAVSTGFRAPTPGQSNLRSRVTSFGDAGELAEQLIIPSNSVIARLKGGGRLEPEKSKQASMGVVFKTESFSITADIFRIKVRDRISLTSPISINEDDVQILLEGGFSDALAFDSVRFFTNDFDTTTRGVDIVTNYQYHSGLGRTNLDLSFNRTHTHVDRFSDNISDFRVRQIEEGLPRDRWVHTLTHLWEAWQGVIQVSYYDKFFEAHADSAELPIESGSAVLVDAELTYFYRDHLSVSVGGRNITDEFPDDNPWAKELGALYPVTSPFGFDGGYYYIRCSYNL